MVFYAEGITRTVTFIASWTAFVGLFLTVMGILLKGRLWHKLSRAAFYLVALVFGVQVIGALPQVGDPGVILSILGLAVGIVYVVGARGYLDSAGARAYFGAPQAPPNS